ncbi:MAG TPA: lanthionine synthetase LanC family protein [Thermoanaerobaculia bacterium]|nr:lanthionine synthetase LanC family protein [Thermoanaerobaculia bacterium]
MKRSSIVLFALFLAIAPLAEGARRRAVGHPPERPATSTPWLVTAIETAAWLESIARPRGEGLAWSNDTAAPDAVLPGLPGTSGAGFFFLRLYQVTKEPRYLAIAERAATYVASTCANTLFDWQGGTVGCGEFLVAVHRETRDPQQLARAEAMATSLLERAKRDGGGLYWELQGTTNLHTGIAHGAGGVIVLMLDLYELTGHARYLETAEAAWRWISRYDVLLGANAIGWKRLTTDTTGYNGWCGGAAGMIFVFDRLYAITGKDEYRERLTATANGLLTTAVATTAGYRWTYHTDRAGLSPLIYCHGSACSIGSLARAYDVIGDERYLAMATAGATHLESRGRTVADGKVWPHVETSPLLQNGFMVGSASVGHGFLRLYRTTRDRRYFELAEAAGRALLAQANRPAPGMAHWPVHVEPIAPQFAEDQATKVAWWDGTAGIGMFLLELHQFAIGVDPPSLFSPANP